MLEGCEKKVLQCTGLSKVPPSLAATPIRMSWLSLRLFGLLDTIRQLIFATKPSRHSGSMALLSSFSLTLLLSYRTLSTASCVLIQVVLNPASPICGIQGFANF